MAEIQISEWKQTNEELKKKCFNQTTKHTDSGKMVADYSFDWTQSNLKMYPIKHLNW